MSAARETRQIGTDRYTVDFDDIPGGWTLMHHLPNSSGSSHSVGHVGKYPDAEQAWNGAIAHANRIYDTGNCDGYIPVRRSLAQKAHWGWLDRDRSACGIDLGGPGGHFRVAESVSDLVARGEFCERC
jgi:hypothetical protein